ncbi:MAG TPA: ankyrin repeat domain-containing protein, partial [Pyrinomonadaceae bacterium]|nr:ankyrin repeat domain-containing protein [Pyrinomonadaceae bacterium]
GMTPLMRAVCEDSIDVVRTLLDRGAEVNQKRHDGFTALALAAFFGRTRIVELLLERGADVRAVTRFGTSPEMWAKARGYREIVDLLGNASETTGLREELSAIPEHDDSVIQLDEPQPAEEKRSFAMPSVTAPRTLPEIQDPPPVIGPAFHPGRAFIARVTSDRRSLATLSLALIFMLGLAIFATYQIKGLLRNDVKQTDSTGNNPAVEPQAAIDHSDETKLVSQESPPQESAPQESVPQQPGNNQAASVAVPNRAAPGLSPESTSAAITVKPNIKILPAPRPSHSSISALKRGTVTRSEQSKQNADADTDLKPAPLTVEVSRDRTIAAPATRTAEPPPVQPAPLGISSSKPRTKVIQWP